MQIKVDQSQFDKVQVLLAGVRNGYGTVTSRAINKTLTGINTDASTIVYKDLTTTKKRIKQNFKVQKATKARVQGQWDSTGEPIGLMSFSGTRQVNTGVSVKVKRAGSRSILKHAFVTKAKNATNVFWRERGIGEGRYPLKRQKRIPWKKVYLLTGKKYQQFPISIRKGPRIEDILAKSENVKKLELQTQARIDKNLLKETNYLLSKL